MATCEDCGASLPDDAVFCPNCGSPVRRMQVSDDIKGTAVRFLVAGLSGAFLSVFANLFSGVYLYFLPSFLASIIVIYIFRINRFREALTAALAVYIFADGIFGRFILGYLYINGIPYVVNEIPQIWDVLSYVFSPISAFIAGYVGVKITPKTKGSQMPTSFPRREGESGGGVIYHL